MNKQLFGAVVAVSLLSEGEKLDKFAGWLGTKAGQGWNITKKAVTPYIATGLESTGKQIADVGRKAAIGTVKLGAKLGQAIQNRSLDLGRKTFYKGQALRNKYSS